MELPWFSISPWLLICILLVIVFGKSIKELVQSHWIEKIKAGSMEILMRKKQENEIPRYDVELRELGEHPPESIDKILEDVKVLVAKDLESKKLTTKDERINMLVDELAKCKLSVMLEIIDSIIFGSQTRLLEYLDSKEDDDIVALKEFYRKASKKYSVAYTDYPFESYLGFLTNHHLIIKEELRCRITGLGRAYLRYRKAMGRMSYKPL